MVRAVLPEGRPRECLVLSFPAIGRRIFLNIDNDEVDKAGNEITVLSIAGFMERTEKPLA